jgi:hypothetical protein
MNLGIVVEGDQDCAAYRELIRKIRGDVDTVLCRPCGNDALLMAKFVGYLKEFHWRPPRSIDKALVIMDSDCSDPSAWEGQLREIYDRSRFLPRFPVHVHATKCKIETWLLADENAVIEVAQQRGKNRQVQAIKIQLETYKEAKERFQRMLSEADLRATARVYQEVAKAANIARIAARCPSFQLFADKVREC